MKRIKAQFASESPARSAGLEREKAERDGFTCKCGRHQPFSNYVLAHWVESLQIKCPQCLRVYKCKEGAVKEISGPERRVSRIKPGGSPERMDPRSPLWRTYHVLNNGARPIVYQPASDYAPTLDLANDEGWTYANKVEPHVKARREDLFRSLIRAEEFPLLSTIERDGLIVGGGDLLLTGIRKDELRQSQVYEFELRDPKGRVSRITLTPEVFAEIMAAFEYEPMVAAPAERKRRAAGG